MPPKSTLPVVLNVATWKLPVPVALVNVNGPKFEPLLTVSESRAAAPVVVRVATERFPVPVALVNVTPCKEETPDETVKFPAETVKAFWKSPAPAEVNVPVVVALVKIPVEAIVFPIGVLLIEPAWKLPVPVALVKVRPCNAAVPAVTCSALPGPASDKVVPVAFEKLNNEIVPEGDRISVEDAIPKKFRVCVLVANMNDGEPVKIPPSLY